MTPYCAIYMYDSLVRYLNVRFYLPHCCTCRVGSSGDASVVSLIVCFCSSICSSVCLVDLLSYSLLLVSMTTAHPFLTKDHKIRHPTNINPKCPLAGSVILCSEAETN